MSYTLTIPGRNNISVQPGTTDTTSTNLVLIGKNTPGYGQYIMQNFLTLLSSSEGASPPGNPLPGQLWWDRTTARLKVFNDNLAAAGYNGFSPVSILTAAPDNNPPPNPNVGDLWWNVTNKQLEAYDVSLGWSVIGPQFTAAQGKTGPFVETMTDASSQLHTVIKFYNNNYVMAIMAFDLGVYPNGWIPTPQPDGFPVIYQGLNLANGLSHQLGTTAAFVTAPTATFNTVAGTVTTNSQPYITQVGSLSSLNAGASNLGQTLVSNLGISNSQLTAPNLVVTLTSTQPYMALRGNLNPSANNTFSLGNASAAWANVFATNLSTTTITATGGVTINGAVTAPALTLTGATGADLSFTGPTSNYAAWNTAGVAPPSFINSSAGTKLLLYPSVGATSADYAIGIDGNTLWNGIPSSSQSFKWYAGTNPIATLSGVGTLTLPTVVTTGNQTVGGTLNVTGTMSGNNISITGTMAGGIDSASGNFFSSMRVVRNNASGAGLNDGMYIGYGNSNNGPTRLFGGGGIFNNVVFDNTNLYPNADATLNLGVGIYRWASLAVVNTYSSGQLNAQGNQGLSSLLNSSTASGAGGIMVQGPGGANSTAYMSFHKPNIYATYLGLDSDNQMAVGGWSAGSQLGYMKVGGLGVGTAAVAQGRIVATDNIIAYYSDQRLKRDIKPIEDALDKVMTLDGVTFRANELAASFGYDGQKPQVGVIAQQIKAVLPEVIELAPFDAELRDGEIVSKSGEDYMTVQYERIVPLLIQAIKELNNKVIKLEQRLGDR